MKNIICIILLFPILLEAQKHNNNFISGLKYFDKDSMSGLTLINFDKDNKRSLTRLKKGKMYIYQTVATISDKTGKLAFYTNGQHIDNVSQDTIENAVFFKYQNSGFTIDQGCLVLPFPEKDSMYLVLTQYPDFKPSGFFGIKKFQYGVVDMSLNNGKGKMISKNIDVMPLGIYPTYGKITAVKKANGKDWWIYTVGEGTPPEVGSNIFYRYQLTKNGFSYDGQQIIDKKIPEGVGTAEFSPDGTKYANYTNVGPNFPHQLHVFDFNRCTGLFSNQKSIVYTNLNDNGVGVAFSPDSRYLYVGLNKKLIQYDTKFIDLKQTEKIVAISKNIKYCGNTTVDFGNMQLAPDGKIYIAGYGCAKAYHIIHEPNKPDTLCKVEQAGLVLPTYYDATMNKFPNFQLGKMDCTVSASEAEEKMNIRAYPNPATTELNLVYNQEILAHSELIIRDVQGEIMYQKSISDKVELSNFAAGIYFLQVKNNAKVLWREKIIVLKE
jgi:hypothetical protein